MDGADHSVHADDRRLPVFCADHPALSDGRKPSTVDEEFRRAGDGRHRHGVFHPVGRHRLIGGLRLRDVEFPRAVFLPDPWLAAAPDDRAGHRFRRADGRRQRRAHRFWQDAAVSHHARGAHHRPRRLQQGDRRLHRSARQPRFRLQRMGFHRRRRHAGRAHQHDRAARFGFRVASVSHAHAAGRAYHGRRIEPKGGAARRRQRQARVVLGLRHLRRHRRPRRDLLRRPSEQFGDGHGRGLGDQRAGRRRAGRHKPRRGPRHHRPRRDGRGHHFHAHQRSGPHWRLRQRHHRRHWLRAARRRGLQRQMGEEQGHGPSEDLCDAELGRFRAAAVDRSQRGRRLCGERQAQGRRGDCARQDRRPGRRDPRPRRTISTPSIATDRSSGSWRPTTSSGRNSHALAGARSASPSTRIRTF